MVSRAPSSTVAGFDLSGAHRRKPYERKRLSISVVPEIPKVKTSGEHKSPSITDTESDLHGKDLDSNQLLILQNASYAPRFSVRVVLLGDCNVGKTRIVSTLTEDMSNLYGRRTVGAEFVRHTIPSLSIDIKIIELSGHRAFHSTLCPAVLSKRPDVVCMVYDNADRATLESLATYWAKLLVEHGISERCRVHLIGSRLPESGRPEINEKLEKTTASKLAKDLGKQQVDTVGFSIEDVSKVSGFFETVAEQAAFRILKQLAKRLKSNDAGLIHSKLILRKAGFSEHFASKYRLEPLSTLVRDETSNKEFDPEEFDDTEDNASSSECTKWLELRDRKILVFSSVREARCGTDPLRKIVLNRNCKTKVLADSIIEINDGVGRNLFIPNSSEVARHWHTAMQEIILAMH